MTINQITTTLREEVSMFERDLLIERTQSGIIRAKAAGKKFGRPSVLSIEDRAVVVDRLAAGVTIAEIAREFKTTRQTMMRVKKSVICPQ